MSFLHDFLGKIVKPPLLWMAKKRLPVKDGTLKVDGLTAKVEIRRDKQGVPHIFAENREDMFFAQGFVHAQDRGWQMEVNRRLALGRVAEVFGKVALGTDRLTRTFGFARLGQRDWETLAPEYRPLVSSYCRGINAFLQHPKSKLPFEFTLAGYKPEPFTEAHLMAFTRLMVLQMSNGWMHELIRAQVIETVGEELAAELMVDYHEDNPVTLPQGIEFNKLTPDGRLEAMNGPFLKRMGGSNAWAVTGAKTDTGKPYLCGDPHLAPLLPAIWYQNYLECPDYKVTGVTLPGVPMVLIGHNPDYAWGITLSYTDIQDLFVEKFLDENCTQYEFKGEVRDTEIIEETIQIKGVKTPHIEKVLVTHHGPVISGVIGKSRDKIAFASPALGKPGVIPGWWNLNLGKNWDDFVHAMQHIQAPGMNIVYADREGNIGYWVTGKSPIRMQGGGEVPVPGWTGEHEWSGHVPFAEMPHSLNPARGFIVSCNHKVVGEDYPYDLGSSWMNGYRAKRMESLLQSQEKFKLNDFVAMQHDFYSIPGLEFAKQYQGFKHRDPTVMAAIKALTEWDGMLDENSVGGSIYQVCKHEMLGLLFERAMGKETMENFIGKGLDPVLFNISEYLGQDTVILLRLLKNPESRWIRKADGLKKVLGTAMLKAVKYLRRRFGSDMSAWKWGRLHKIEFPHAMSVQKPMDHVFNIGPFPIGGDTDTVCQTAFKPSDPFGGGTVTHPSYRQLIDLSNWSNSRWVLPPGQSGQLGSPHYDDQVEDWIKGEYHPMRWERAEIEAATEWLLVLE